MPIFFAKKEVEVVKELLKAAQAVTLSYLLTKAGVHESYARRTMQNLVDEGLVVRTAPEGIGEAALYEVNEGDARAKLEKRVKDTEEKLAKKKR